MRSLSVAVCLFAAALAAFAQSDRGTITGTISDPAGAVVAGAQVEAKNVANGVTYEAASTGTGNYTLAQLPAGDYEMTVTVPGFKKSVRTGITVQVAGTLRIDVGLEVGTAAEAVTVTETAPLLKTESGELSHNMTTERLDNLPVINLGFGSALGNVRNPLQAIALLPGSYFANDNAVRINGMPANTQSIRIEGQDATNMQHREFNQVTQVSNDAIQEVSVQTSNFAAEYGQAGGGYFNYTMKSGTNQFHGSGYLYLVNEAFNAGLPFTDAAVVTSNPQKAGELYRPVQRRFDYGGTVGGPIHLGKLYDGRNKSFFFFSFERFQEDKSFPISWTLPTDAYRSGNFGAAMNPFGPFPIPVGSGADAAGNPMFYGEVFDPKTTKTVGGITLRDPFPGNIVPANRFDPVAVNVQNYIPHANKLGVLNNGIYPPYTGYQHTTNYSIKLDHSISPPNKLSGFF